MAASSRAQVLDLYRAMLRESKRFGAYNYRTYAIRRIRDAFRENKNVKDPVEIQALVNKAKRDLGIIRRQCFKIITPDRAALFLRTPLLAMSLSFVAAWQCVCRCEAWLRCPDPTRTRRGFCLLLRKSHLSPWPLALLFSRGGRGLCRSLASGWGDVSLSLES
ncbi:LYR motif-containing protein 4 isoform X1 [Cervus elaphus]|uniref:LYR motif-containing protein 4 isoform X1 n=1 Tax=Cervus elaphus TaxID=9860 RepID=UPI001CC322A3|nr:LYR motif-containing protein 4 isoform X1 [Cervus elaphus]